ncbi:MAG TPA: thioredoxin-disulfide reductase [Acidobacteriota bacterium]|nr:thioredoxin-disulfide reductase [Acidobacteriota bacterium]
MKHYDVIIIGAGPAGLTAALYTSRGKLSTLLLDKLAPGGQLLNTEKVEDYPGFESITGLELSERFEKQARSFGTEIKIEEVIEMFPSQKLVRTYDGEYQGKVLIITSGGYPRKLEIPGEKELAGKGVSYCAICDGAFFKDQVIAVVGGGNSAVEESIFLTKYVKKLYLVHRRDEFRAQKIFVERATKNEKIEFVLDSVMVEISGDKEVERAFIRNVTSGERRQLDVQGVFIFIGYIPNRSYFREHLDHDTDGYLLTDSNMQTSIPGVYAAGDIRAQLVRQITTAAGDATTAAVAAEKYIENLQHNHHATADAIPAKGEV